MRRGAHGPDGGAQPGPPGVPAPPQPAVEGSAGRRGEAGSLRGAPRRPHRRHALFSLPAVLQGGQWALGLYADRAADTGLLAHLRPEDLLLVSVRRRQSHRHHRLQQESQ